MKNLVSLYLHNSVTPPPPTDLGLVYGPDEDHPIVADDLAEVGPGAVGLRLEQGKRVPHRIHTFSSCLSYVYNLHR
jgi:hypothetical protein